MKKFLALGGLLLSMGAYAQSYLILNNGVTLTTDKAGFVYDFTHFIMPYKVELSGGQFLVVDEKFVSVDSNGYLYTKDEKAPKKTKGKGNNYVVAENGTIYTFDSKGFLYKLDKDQSILKKAVGFGGNFFTVKDDKVELFTVNNNGNYFKMNIQGLLPAMIATFGGNYFMTTQGVIYTVTKDGFVYSKAEVKTGLIKKMGGNFFVDSKDALYTVSEDGYLYLPSIPPSLKIESIMRVGANYFLDQQGKMFVVDQQGNVFEREIKDHDMKSTRILSM